MDTAGTRGQALQATFRDGLGTRRLRDGADGPLEVLTLQQHLTANPTFEFLLRERVSRFAQFRQPCFARVHDVERAGGDTPKLAIVSDYVPGVRLSRMLAIAEQNLLPLDVDSALCLIRKIVTAVAMLHEAAPDASHGALAPERIVITQDARLVVVEHVLGGALEQLPYTLDRYWADLRVALEAPVFADASIGRTADSFGFGEALEEKEPEPRFTRRTDVVQLGAIALALLLGRPLGADEYPAGFSDLATGTFGLGGAFEPLPAWLKEWLFRALWFDPAHAFISAVDARHALDVGLAKSGYSASQASLESFLEQYRSSVDAPLVITPPRPVARSKPTAPKAVPVAPAPVAVAPIAVPVAPVPVPAAPPAIPVAPIRAQVAPTAAPPVPTPIQVAPAPIEYGPTAIPVAPTPIAVAPTVHPIASTPIEPAPTANQFASAPIEFAPTVSQFAPSPIDVAPPVNQFAPTPMATTASRFGPERQDREDEEEVDVRSNSNRSRLIAAAVVLVALTSGGAMAARRYLASSPSASATATGTLAVQTTPAGAAVVIDGVQRGVTPLSVSLNAGPHTLELSTDGAHRTIPITVSANSELSQFIDMPKAAVAVGQLEVRTDPSGAKISVDGQLRGNSPLTVTGLATGNHSVTLENELGSVNEDVTIAPGTTASLVVPLRGPQGAPVSGWMSITAPAELQVFENQRLLGNSRTDRIMVTAGRHDVEFVNEALGYRSAQTIQVGPGQVAKVKPDWPQGTIAINASPWANVWLDGQELGETPVGNTQVPIGTHEVIFRHPQFGEQRFTTTVTASTPARLSVDMRKK